MLRDRNIKFHTLSFELQTFRQSTGLQQKVGKEMSYNVASNYKKTVASLIADRESPQCARISALHTDSNNLSYSSSLLVSPWPPLQRGWKLHYLLQRCRLSPSSTPSHTPQAETGQPSLHTHKTRE